MKRVAVCAMALMLCSLFAAGALGQVTFERILNASKEPQNWLTYSGDYEGRRFSALDQVNTGNVKNLAPRWVYQTGALGKFETTPLVVDGILYGTGQDNRAFALDARTGRPIWQYQYVYPSDVRMCCGRVNRGFAILGDKVFFGTLDAHLVALDAIKKHVTHTLGKLGAADRTEAAARARAAGPRPLTPHPSLPR